MFKRISELTLSRLSKFPAVTILGPRQAGKTTLSQTMFPKHAFVTFDRLDQRLLAQEDPEAFFRIYGNDQGIIIDEFQYVPHIIEHVKYLIDSKKRGAGYYVLTGSENYLTKKNIRESLAGRTSILTLLPLSISELTANSLITKSTHPEETILFGGYPKIYDEHIPPTDYYSYYAQTYLERDVKGSISTDNLPLFSKFITLCAARSGQILNLESLGNDLGISGPTVLEWISILQDNYIVFLLQPFARSLDKRLIKRPKLYFYDTGLACSLLGIKTAKDLRISPFYGSLFETLIISDVTKQYFNASIRPDMYFWGERGGKHEIDCIIKEGQRLIPLEIKSAESIGANFFKSLSAWHDSTKSSPAESYVVYGGSSVQKRAQGIAMGWQEAGSVLKSIHDL